MKLQSWQTILIGLVLGAITGLVFGHRAVVIEPIGQLFIRAIHMIIVPVVFFAIVNAICSVDCMNKMKRLSLKAIVVYSVFMLLSSGLALTVVYFIQPGLGLKIHSTLQAVSVVGKHHSIAETIVNVVPTNIFESFVSGNIIQLILFSILFGVALNLSVEKTKPIRDFVQAGFHLTVKLAQLVMKLAPLGVFALIASMTGEYGTSVVVPLLKLVFSVYLGCMLVWVAYAICLAIVFRKHPGYFFKQILKPMLIAYTTSSSAATLPVTLNCAVERLKIAPPVANFLLPLGSSLNLNGLSVYLSVATVFAANFMGVHLSFENLLFIPFLVLGTAMGAAAVPGSALIVMGAIQTSLGIPLGAIPLIAAVDRLNDMAQTSTNVVGDLFAAHVIDQFEKTSEAAVASNATVSEAE